MSEAEKKQPPAALVAFFRLARQLAQEARRAEAQKDVPNRPGKK